jgi:hypothetical protein
MRIRVERLGGFTHILALCNRVTEHLSWGLLGQDITLGPTLAPSGAALATQRNAGFVIGGGVEPPAPAQVVLPACGRSSALAPEGDPPRFLIAGNPRPLEAALLVEGHDVTHGRGVYTR